MHRYKIYLGGEKMNITLSDQIRCVEMQKQDLEFELNRIVACKRETTQLNNLRRNLSLHINLLQNQIADMKLALLNSQNQEEAFEPVR